ncbi:MAG: phosphotransferase, partial [Candidatus Aenigmarchaeota archaeon]|nr:phosphotransferase [Candidatus Aenigmarchaeota archaeon]
LVDYRGHVSFTGNAVDWTYRWLPNEENEFSRLAREHLEHDRKELSEAQLPQQAIHWDFHGGNMKFSDKVYVFDFEFAHRDARVMDVANTLVCLAAMKPGEIDYSNAESFIMQCELDFGKARAFVEGYGGLSANELRILPEALDVAWLGWSLYTFANKKAAASTLKKALHFPVWVSDNANDIRRLF